MGPCNPIRMFLLKDVLKRKVYRTVDHGPGSLQALKFNLEAFGLGRDLDQVAIRPGKAQSPSVVFHLFVFVYEEPTLRTSFGPEYRHFCAAVPRWLPRLHAWPGPQENA
jgi:hypothetical protein